MRTRTVGPEAAVKSRPGVGEIARKPRSIRPAASSRTMSSRTAMRAVETDRDLVTHPAERYPDSALRPPIRAGRRD